MTIAVIALAAIAAVAFDKVDLNGIWEFRLVRDRTLETAADSNFTSDDMMTVPGCWDAMSAYYNQRGTGLYRRTFELAADVAQGFLVVDGCGIRSRYWLDGREIGTSVIPWMRLDFPTGPLKAGRHELVAAVDSVVDNEKVRLFWDFYDFYAFGGFYHGVWLETTPSPLAIRRVVVRTRDYHTGLVELEAQFAGEGAKGDFEADVAFDGRSVERLRFRGFRAETKVPAFRLWSPESPNLHCVRVSAAGTVASARFGIRQVATAKGRVLLNGIPVYLKGVNRHEAHYEFGAATPATLAYEDVRNLKSLGGNFLRGSHYAQTETLLNLCDELGIMVWEESLGWGNLSAQLNDPEFCRLQEEETRLMVRNSINHPSVIISAFLNEPASELPECKRLVDRLIDVIRAEDTGHLVTFACHHWEKDICNECTDLIAVNTYPCWYGYKLESGTHEDMQAKVAKCYADVVRRFRTQYPGDERPIVLSEIGVKADYGARDPRGKAQYTEDFQDEFETVMLEELFANRELGGIAIWQFTDAKTYTRRTNGMIMRSYGVNTGGIYDLYRRPKLVVESIRRLFATPVQ